MAALQSLQPPGGGDPSTREGKILAISDVGVALDGGRVESTSSMLSWATSLLQSMAGDAYEQIIEFDDSEYKVVPNLVEAAIKAKVTDGSVGVAVAMLGEARLWALGFGGTKKTLMNARSRSISSDNSQPEIRANPERTLS